MKYIRQRNFIRRRKANDSDKAYEDENHELWHTEVYLLIVKWERYIQYSPASQPRLFPSYTTFGIPACGLWPLGNHREAESSDPRRSAYPLYMKGKENERGLADH